VAYEERILAALRTGWHRTPQALNAQSGGAVSRTWSVVVGDEQLIAKLVPLGERPQFEAGLAAAEHLRTCGVDAGAPVRTADGAATVLVDDGVLALLRRVPGRPLEADDPLDQQWWGDLLGTVHRALDGFSHPGLVRWHWVRPDAPHLDLEPWLRPAVTDAVAALTKLTVTDQLTYGVLHGEPFATAFRMDVGSGRTGLIGWGSAATGPLMYDVAAAVIDAGGPVAAVELLDGYAAAGPVPRDEVQAALPVLLRFRHAVQADRYARRIVASRTAPASTPFSPAEDLVGLRRARDALATCG
jgi:Ser/Thr protein kinase RdoA (MazF antagonist)